MTSATLKPLVPAVGFVHVSEAEKVAGLIDKLLAVDERRAESMRAAACRLQAAFTFRNDSSAEQPSAAEYILDAACQAAKRMKQARPFTTAERQRVPDFSRCTL